MEKSRLIIPLACLLALAGIIGGIVLFNNKSKDFSLPDKTSIKSDMKNRGYTPKEVDFSDLKKLGIKVDFYQVGIDKSKDKDKEIPLVYSYNEYGEGKDAFKCFENYYSSAYYLKKRGDIDGTVKYYYNEKKQKGFILYDMKLESNSMVDSYAFSQAGGSLFDAEKGDYIYGGMYYDGKKVMLITTKDGAKRYEVKEIMDEFKLPH